MTEFFFNGVCPDCFCEVQKEKNSCTCPFIRMKDKDYYCSFCEEFHGPFNWVVCKECAKEEQDSGIQDKKKIFFSVGLPSAFAGVVVGLFLG